MADLLRVCKQFPEFRDAISVSFVERSPLLRDTQCKKLECVDVKEILNEKGEKRIGDYSEANETMVGYYSKNGGNIKVSWYGDRAGSRQRRHAINFYSAGIFRCPSCASIPVDERGLVRKIGRYRDV